MSGTYYRVIPEPPKAETYGFKKVTQEELGNIISRLTRQTYNSRVHTVEQHMAHNYRRIHSAPPPRSPTYCSRRRYTPPKTTTTTTSINSRPSTAATAINETANTNDPASSSLPHPPDTTQQPEELQQPTISSSNAITTIPDADEEEEEQQDAQDEADRENDEDHTSNDDSENNPTATASAPPLKPHIFHPEYVPERKFTEEQLRRVLRRIQRPTRAYVRSRKDYEPNLDDDIMAGDDHTTFDAGGRRRRPLTTSERKKAFFMMSRPTTASRAKSTTDCVFCPTNDEDELKANKDLSLPFRYSHAPNERVATAEEASTILSRVSSPTKASLRGLGKSCHRAAPDYEAMQVQNPSLPLVSGLARTPKVSQIVNRLHYGTRRIIIVAGDVDEERSNAGSAYSSNREGDMYGGRGTQGSSRDERYQMNESARLHKRRPQKTQQKQSCQHQAGRRYHGYKTSATPISAWS